MIPESLTWPMMLLFMVQGPPASPESAHCPLPCHLSSRPMPLSDQSPCHTVSDNRDPASVFTLSTKFTVEKEVSVLQGKLPQPPLIG